jgi:hypothetical protein
VATALGTSGAAASFGSCACLRRELSGEPDAGNLHLRFDEGRVGRALCVALSPTLPALFGHRCREMRALAVPSLSYVAIAATLLPNGRGGSQQRAAAGSVRSSSSRVKLHPECPQAWSLLLRPVVFRRRQSRWASASSCAWPGLAARWPLIMKR